MGICNSSKDKSKKKFEPKDIKFDGVDDTNETSIFDIYFDFVKERWYLWEKYDSPKQDE